MLPSNVRTATIAGLPPKKLSHTVPPARRGQTTYAPTSDCNGPNEKAILAANLAGELRRADRMKATLWGAGI
jgi:hypothetical protein